MATKGEENLVALILPLAPAFAPMLVSYAPNPGTFKDKNGLQQTEWDTFKGFSLNFLRLELILHYGYSEI